MRPQPKPDTVYPAEYTLFVDRAHSDAELEESIIVEVPPMGKRRLIVAEEVIGGVRLSEYTKCEIW